MLPSSLKHRLVNTICKIVGRISSRQNHSAKNYFQPFQQVKGQRLTVMANSSWRRHFYQWRLASSSFNIQNDVGRRRHRHKSIINRHFKVWWRQAVTSFWRHQIIIFIQVVTEAYPWYITFSFHQYPINCLLKKQILKNGKFYCNTLETSSNNKISGDNSAKS